MNTQEIIDAFDFLDTWEERYELIAELGRNLTPLPESEKTDENLVPGCTTRTWLTGQLTTSDPAVMEFRADAEGPLVRGLVALLLMPFQRKTPDEILKTDSDAFVGRLGLDSALSTQRQAGMQAFFVRIKRIASQC